MAKRKKLNKKVVVFLGIFVAVIAIAVTAMVIARLPKDPKVYYERAQEQRAKAESLPLEDKKRAYNDALKNLQIAVQESNDPLYPYELAQLQMEYLSTIKNIPESEARARGSQIYRALDQALRRDPKFVEARRMQNDLHWYSLPQSHDYKDFINKVSLLIEQDPDNAIAYLRRATAQAALETSEPGTYTDAALADFRHAIGLQSDNPEAWLGLIRFLVALERPEEVEQEFKNAIEANPTSTRLRVTYASFLRARDRGDEALAQLQKGIDQAPDSARPYIALAEYHNSAGDRDKALAVLAKAIEVDDTEYTAYQFMAAIYGRMRQREQATEAIRAGLKAVDRRLQGETDQELTDAQRERLVGARQALDYTLANLLLDRAGTEPENRDEFVAEAGQVLVKMEEYAPGTPQYHKLSGRLALADGDTQRAAELLEQADAGFEGEDPETSILLINLYSISMPSKAEEYVDRLLAKPQYQNTPDFLLKKAEFEMRYQRLGEARKLVERALRAEPDNVAAQERLAQLDVLAAGGTSIPQDVELTPWTVRQIVIRAQQAWNRDEQDDAVRMLESLRQRVPDNMLVVQQLLDCYLSRKQQTQAEALLVDALRYHPDSPELLTLQQIVAESDEAKRVQLWLGMADKIEDPLQRALKKVDICGRLNDLEGYVRFLEEAEKVDPKAPGVIERRYTYALMKQDWNMAEAAVAAAKAQNLDEVGGRFYEARLHRARKQYPQAIELYKSILEDRPTGKNVSTAMGECYLMLNDYANAAEAFKVVTDVDMTYVPALIGMARASRGLDNQDDYVKWVERAHALAPDDPRVQRMYLSIAEKSGKPEELVAARERILRRSPEDMENRFHLGRLYVQTHQYGKAEGMFQTLWKEHPNKLMAARVLVLFYGDTNQYAKGMGVLEELLAQTDDKVAAYMLSGDFLTFFSDEEAANAYGKAIAADPQDGRGYLAMATFLGNRKKYSEAAEQIRKYLEIDPDSRDQQKSLASYLLEAEQLDEADEQLHKLLASDPSDPQTLILAGALELRRKEYDRAEDFFNRALREDPNSYDAYYRRHLVYLIRGDLKQARRDLEEARKLSDDPRLTMQLANVLKSLGDFQSAEFAYVELLQKNPGYEPANQALLDLYYQRQRWSAMETLLIQAKGQFPSDPSYLLREGQMWIARKEPARAATALQSALQINSKYAEALRLYLDLLVGSRQYDVAAEVAGRYADVEGFEWVRASQARITLLQGRTDEAEGLFVETLRNATDENLPYVVSQISQAYGPSEGATKLAGWIPQVRGNDWRAYSALGELWLAQRNNQQAVVIFQKAHDLAENDADKAGISQNLGTTHYLLGNFAEAEKAYLEVLRINPNDLGALNNLAYMYTVDLNQPEKGLPYAEKAAAMRPMDGSIADTYGWTLYRVGNLREAQEQLTRSVQLSPRQATSRYHFGMVLEERGLLSDAAREYAEAAQLARLGKDEQLSVLIQEAQQRVQQKISGEEQ